jgi:hypothetical protein
MNSRRQLVALMYVFGTLAWTGCVKGAPPVPPLAEAIVDGHRVSACHCSSGRSGIDWHTSMNA